MAERNPQLNPKTGFITQRFRVQSATERQEYEKSILRSPPPGMRNFIRWVDEDYFEFGVEHVAAPAPVPAPEAPAPAGSAEAEAPVQPAAETATDDGLEAKSDAELQTLMGLKGLKYDKKKFVRGVALAQLRGLQAKAGG